MQHSDDEGRAVYQAVVRRLALTPDVHLALEGQAPDTGQDMALHIALGGQGLRLTLAPHRGFGPHYEAWVPFEEAPGLPQAVDAGVQAAMQALSAMADLERMGTSALRATLDPNTLHYVENPYIAYNLQAFAVRRLAELRDHGAAGALRALVERAAQDVAEPMEEALALRATGSLMALRDPLAVLPMIALSQHKEPAFVVQMAHAIGTVGGRMAEAYLVTLASGHLDEEVRDGARVALEEMLGRQGHSAGPEI